MRREAELAAEELAGEKGVILYKALRARRNFSEFKLADKIDMDINETRSTLYRLHSQNLVSFVKKKDKKKGWYIYYWTFNEREAKRVWEKIKKSKRDELKEKIKREGRNGFFSCRNRCGRMEFEEAYDANFRCPECGSIMDYENNKEKMQKIREELDALR